MRVYMCLSGRRSFGDTVVVFLHLQGHYRQMVRLVVLDPKDLNWDLNRSGSDREVRELSRFEIQFRPGILCL